MKRFGLFLISVLVMTSITVAGGEPQRYTLSGQVTDTGGNPLPGATITLEGTFLGAICGPDGNYSIKKIPAGTYTVTASYLGFRKENREISISSDRNENFKLAEATIIADEVVVRGIRASRENPFASSEVGKEMVKKLNTGADIPFLLLQVPSLVETSEAGTGIGYSAFRIRGTDPSRINITLDGIPMNDAESQQVFWVDMPDLAGSISDIQVQRGVGTSTNGAAAFGASVNMTTMNPSEEPYIEASSTYGSFNTIKGSLKAGTGLLHERLMLDLRVSGIKSDGYIDRSWSEHRSIFGTATYKLKKGRLKANFLYGEELTAISWWGVPADSLSTNRTYNPAGAYIDAFGDLKHYHNQVDNYTQTHFQLLYNQQLTPGLYLNVAGHFTRGLGYYEQYKEDDALADYGLPNWLFAGVLEFTTTDLVRRKWLFNYFGGAVYNLSYSKERIDASFGGGFNRYTGDHFGRLIWMRVAGTTEKDWLWYVNGSTKDDFNSYAKISFRATDKLNLYADLQYRYIGYRMGGTDDDLRDLNLDVKYHFLNPKAGLFYKFSSNHDVYASFSVANREPTRANYKDAMGDDEAIPVPETLYDFETGYNFRSARASAGVNLYYMYYTDQLVPTGELSNVGYPIMTNVKKSYRAGIELVASLKPFSRFGWNGALTLSRNKIRDYTEHYTDWDNFTSQLFYISVNMGDVDIAYSPSVIGTSEFVVSPFDNLSLHLVSKYVGSQYFDNTANETRKIDAYLVNNFRADYNFSLGILKDASLQVQVNNIFNNLYESNAYGGYWYEDGIEYNWSYWFPQAGINWLTRLTVRF